MNIDHKVLGTDRPSRYMGCKGQLTKDDLKKKLSEFERQGYSADEKLDGQWGEITIEKGKVLEFLSRPGQVKDFEELMSHRFPSSITGVLAAEVSYGSSNARMRMRHPIGAALDFIWLDTPFGSFNGTKMEDADRRSVLDRLSSYNMWDSQFGLVEHTDTDFYSFYRRVIEGSDGFGTGEGLVLRKQHGSDTHYKPGKSKHCVKVKKEVLIDMVVMELEFRDPTKKWAKITVDKGQTDWVERIRVGMFDPKTRRFKKCCWVGSMSEEAREWFTKNPDKALDGTRIVIVKGNEQWEGTGSVRHPSIYQPPGEPFLHTHKRPEECMIGELELI